MSGDEGSPFGGAEPVFQPGEEFHGYVVDRALGKGGLGSVWLARHEVLDTLFAIKILDPKVAEEQPEYVKRFVREAKLATKIRHPNLVAVHDAGYDSAKGVYFLVMDYVKGDTLRDVVAFGGAQSEKDAVRIILQVADVLAAAQCFGMVHRDLKPENIMLTEDGVVKLLDLGVAKISEGFDSLKTKANTVFGTPAYISPEQALDASTVDTRADIYSLGVILFELLAGQRPYTGNDPTEVLQQLLSNSPIPDVRNFNSKVSPKISAVLSLMCAKRLEDRLATPKAVIETFARLGYALPASASAEIVPDAGGEGGDGPSMDELISHLPAKPADSSLEMETQDAEIQAFVSRLKQKRLMHRLFLVGIGVAVVLAVVLAILLIKGK